MRAESIPAISAIYFGLLTSGYDYAQLGREAAHAAALRPFQAAMEPLPFFAQTRQTTCEVYPYWPRAALLETATFHLTADGSAWRDRSGLTRAIAAMSNIADNERDAAFHAWLDGFPAALTQILHSAAFRRYMAWEQEWLAAQNRLHNDELTRLGALLSDCRTRYASPVQQVHIVLNPIKCIYSADYHLAEGCFVFSSGRFQPTSIVHEFLHHAVHPVVSAHQAEIPPREYPGLDRSYYAAGPANAFEEHMVRRLTDAVLADRPPEDLEDYLHLLLQNSI